MAIATSTAILIAAGVGAATTGASLAISSDQQQKAKKEAARNADVANQKAEALVQAQKDSQAKAELAAQEEVSRRLKNITRTIFTSPLGTTDTKLGS